MAMRSKRWDSGRQVSGSMGAHGYSPGATLSDPIYSMHWGTGANEPPQGTPQRAPRVRQSLGFGRLYGISRREERLRAYGCYLDASATDNTGQGA